MLSGMPPRCRRHVQAAARHEVSPMTGHRETIQMNRFPNSCERSLGGRQEGEKMALEIVRCDSYHSDI